MDERKTSTGDPARAGATASPAVRAAAATPETRRPAANGREGDRYSTGDDGRYTHDGARHADRGVSANGRSPVTLMRQLVSDVAVLLRKEVALAASEVNQSVQGVTAALGSMAGGGAVLHAGIIFLLAAAALGLAQVMALWLATLIVGAVVTLIGFVMVQAGRKKLEPAAFKPERTMDSLSKDKDALRRHTP